MKENINEELNYIKYLLGYKKGVVISEQSNVLNEATTATTKDYSQAVGDYVSDGSKYGITSINLGSKDATTGEWIWARAAGDPKPTVVQFMAYGYDLTWFCGAKATKSEYFGVEEPKIQPDTRKWEAQKLYQAAKKTEGSTKTDSELRIEFEAELIKIGKKICENIKSIEGGSFVSDGPDATIDPNGNLYFNQKGVGTNNYIEPRITVTEQSVGNITYWDVVGFGYFPTLSSSSNFAKVFLKKLKEEVFKSPKIIEAVKTGKKDLISVTVANIRGGASNTYGGPVPAEITITDFNEIGNPKIVTVNGTTNFTKNKELAKKRATNVWEALKLGLPVETGELGKIRISKQVTENISGYSIETGGVDDQSDKRDWTKYPIPGQQVYISMRIELRPVIEPDKVGGLNNKCLWNTTITMDFGVNDKSMSHQCDVATFDVYANNVYIGSIDLGNEGFSKDSKQMKTEGATGVTASKKPATTSGGAVSGSLKITDESLGKSIIEASKNGEVVITAKGKDYSHYDTRFGTGGNWSTHSEIPWIQVLNPSGVIIFNSGPNTKETLVRCGGRSGETAAKCPTWKLAEFNPCAKDASTGTLSTITEK